MCEKNYFQHYWKKTFQASVEKKIEILFAIKGINGEVTHLLIEIVSIEAASKGNIARNVVSS